MIVVLLAFSLLIALLVAGAFTFLVRTPLNGILTRIVGSESAQSWHKFALFAIYASGVARGIDTNRLRHDLQLRDRSNTIEPFGIEKWILELYRVAEDSLTGVMIASFTIFSISLIAFVIVRGLELKKGNSTNSTP